MNRSVNCETSDAPLCQWPFMEKHRQPLPQMSYQYLNSHPIYQNPFSHGFLLTAQAHASTALHHECQLQLAFNLHHCSGYEAQLSRKWHVQVQLSQEIHSYVLSKRENEKKSQGTAAISRSIHSQSFRTFLFVNQIPLDVKHHSSHKTHMKLKFDQPQNYTNTKTCIFIKKRVFFLHSNRI